MTRNEVKNLKTGDIIDDFFNSAFRIDTIYDDEVYAVCVSRDEESEQWIEAGGDNFFSFDQMINEKLENGCDRFSVVETF